MSSSEKETSPVKGRTFNANMKDKGKQEKAKMFQEVAEDKMAEGKDTTKEKKGKEGKTKGAKYWKQEEVSMLIKYLASGMFLKNIIQNAMLKRQHIKK